MRKHIIGGLALLLTAAAPMVARAVPVDCDSDSTALGLALSAAAPGDVIEVDGLCTEGGEIRVDDLTIQDLDSPAATVEGQLFVNGARRITIHRLTLQGNNNLETHGVDVVTNASAILDEVTIKNFGTGVWVFGNAYVEVINSSTIELNDIGILFGSASSGIVSDSNILNNTSEGIELSRNSTAFLRNNEILSSSEDTFGIFIEDGAAGTLVDNTITTSSSGGVSLDLTRGSEVQLRGGNNLTSDSNVILVRDGSAFHQRAGDQVNGRVRIEALSNAEFRDVRIVGNVEVVDHSLLEMQDQSGDPSKVSVTGNISVSRDSGLNFIGSFPV